MSDILYAFNIIGATKFLSISIIVSFVVTYILFQKRLLPHSVAGLASKILFYPTFPITAMLRLGNYWTKVDETLYLGCAPMGFLNHPETMHKLGIRGVVNMCYEYPGPKSKYEKLGILQLHLPTVDHTEPTVESLKRAVKFIADHKEKGEKVYVHCKAGHGRAAAVALSWLIHENRDVNTSDLNAALRQKRKVRPTLYNQSNIIQFKSWINSNK